MTVGITNIRNNIAQTNIIRKYRWYMIWIILEDPTYVLMGELSSRIGKRDVFFGSCFYLIVSSCSSRIFIFYYVSLIQYISSYFFMGLHLWLTCHGLFIMYYHYLIYVYYGIISSTILLFYSIDPFFISFFRLSLSLTVFDWTPKKWSWSRIRDLATSNLQKEPTSLAARMKLNQTPS